jgi:hypothetical protein
MPDVLATFPDFPLPLNRGVGPRRFPRHLFQHRQLRQIPSTTQCFNQLHRSGHLLYLRAGQILLVSQQCGLRDDHIHVRIDAGLVAS